MKKGLLIPAAALLICGEVAAQEVPAPPGSGTDGFQNAEQLYSYCRGSSVAGQEYCFAYIAAVADSVRAYQTWFKLHDVCLRAAVTHGALAETFASYFEKNPSLGRNQAASVVVLAMQEQFPCPVVKPSRTPR